MSLQDIARLFGRNVSVDDALVAKQLAPALDAKLTFEEALAAALANSGLTASLSGGGAVIQKVSASGGAQGDIVVTGSRIRGAPIASTTLTYQREEMRSAGQSSLADAIRAIPQNFGGGQNAGVGYNVPAGNGVDLDGGATINLRGLGSDATLTLLDGRRMSYAGATQGIDVSAIPFGAIERIDVVPDGASALFGSDAVAGVANVILRRDFDRLETSARLGGSTDGGNFQQQYGATAGKTWGSGSATLSYEFARTTAVEASQRDYAQSRRPGVTLSPYLRHHNAALVARQSIFDNLTFDVDLLYNKRWWAQTLPLNSAGDLTVSRADFSRTSQSWTAAPSLTLALPADWRVSLGGSYGWNRSEFGGIYTYGTATSSANSGVYRNVTQNVELSGNGNVFELPGGTVKAALGMGYRQTLFTRTGSSASAFIDASQDSYYAFGELSVPVFAPGQVPILGESLDLSLAARYERYPDVDFVVTPKLGAIYAPTKDISLKGSWGRSFRTPTLYEQYRPTTTALYAASSFGGSATGGTVLYVSGGNADLQPERSTNWSATLDLHPRAFAGLTLEVSYFAIHYRNRIVTPIMYTSQALSSSAYAQYVTANPDAAEQAAAIAKGTTFTNYSGSAYDSANVIAIVDNSSVNAGRQDVQGVDARVTYDFRARGGTARMLVNASYLKSQQQISAEQAVTQMAGTLFNPPHLRARGEVSWRNDTLSLVGAVNYIGPVQDTRSDPSVRIAGMVPVDFTIRYHFDRTKGPLAGIDAIASLQNAFNDEPSPIATTAYTDTPYDSTNYTPFGRVVSLTVTKAW
ncbi:TonB-dependent receptor plug domain-containing protein [Novosphingobium sp. Rr 2-17]|uniref:TonB-dependent receptor plug domain-containing protein n=1 Tax=Novosphingobium sp. Rr 2-17 TaxID=555793 RepID=UPI00030E0260|nr:TonB-dependent receptor [Novosphingobium sp. Rr 2-17]